MIVERPVSALLPSPTPSANNVSDTYSDNMHVSPTAMLAVKIYAFGGLAFMMGIMLFALGVWVWTVIIKREWANSPPDLELHPEHMRKRERAREERLKRKKEERLQKNRERDRKEEDKYTPPPIHLNQKERRSSFLSTTSTLRSPNRSSSLLTKGRKSVQRKSSFSVSPSKGLRVSWASSAATVDANGHTSEKLIETESKRSSLPSIKFPFDVKSVASTSIDTPTPIPRARISIPRLSVSIETRAPRGDEMIAATTPDICENWSKPTDPFPVCRCGDPVDPLDTRKLASCDIHHYND